MSSKRTWGAGAAVLVILALAAAYASFAMNLWDVSDETLMARYGGGSRMMVVDGVKLRVKDEGSGPAVVLIHGAYGTLDMWDGWASVLVKRRRVIRFDGPPEGLSGPDPKGYGHQRLADLAYGLTRQLGVETFAVGGTSRGGQAAFILAAQHPERVTHLILANTPAFPSKNAKQPFAIAAVEWFSDTFLNGYRPRLYWRLFLGNLFVDRTQLTERMVAEYADMSNRAGKAERLRLLKTTPRLADRNRALIASLQAPTLLIASSRDHALPLSHERTLASWFDPAKLTFLVTSDVGHFPSLENGAVWGKVVADFLDRPGSPAAGGGPRPK